MMKVKEILESKKRRGELISVSANDDVMKAVKCMSENDTGSTVVMEGSKMVGMLTFREIIKYLAEKGTVEGAEISQIMDDDPVVTTPGDSVDQIRNVMVTRHLRYLPVMEDGDLRDVISFYDVARALAKEVDFENRLLKQYIANWPESSEEES
jgi:CBS domain-containing protein